MDCLFCKITQQEIPASIVYDDEHCLAFNDINPQAPIHQLIIPKEHIATLNDLTPEHQQLVGHLLLVARQLAQQNELAESGYRVLTNCNAGAGQTVFHLHLHLLGGRTMHWPPG